MKSFDSLFELSIQPICFIFFLNERYLLIDDASSIKTHSIFPQIKLNAKKVCPNVFLMGDILHGISYSNVYLLISPVLIGV